MPDLAIMFRDVKTSCVAIWTVLDVLEPTATAMRLAQKLSLALAENPVSDCKYLIVVGGAKNIEQGNPGGRVLWMAVPLMLQDSLDEWSKTLLELITDV